MIERLNRPWKRKLAAYGCILFIIFEFANVPPFKTTNIGDAPEVYRWLKEQNEEALVVEYPIGNDVEYIFYQRVHKKRLVNGALKGTEAYSATEKIVDILKPGTSGILEKLGVTYVIVHLDRYNEKSERVEIMKKLDEFDKAYGLELIKDFGNIKVFKISEG